MARVRSSDYRLARSTRLRDRALDRRREADWLLDRWEAEAERMGVTILPKTSLFGVRWQSLSTAFYKQIRTGKSYASRPPEWRAVTLGHEIYHSRQWRAWGRTRFRTRYLFSGRFRLAIEAQAYAESVRILVAQGASRRTVDDYIDRVTSKFARTYWLRHLRGATTLLDVVMNEAHAAARAAVRKAAA